MVLYPPIAILLSVGRSRMRGPGLDSGWVGGWVGGGVPTLRPSLRPCLQDEHIVPIAQKQWA